MSTMNIFIRGESLGGKIDGNINTEKDF